MDMEATGSSHSELTTPVLITKLELFEVLKSDNFFKQSTAQCNKRLLNYILDKFCVYKQSEDSVNRIKCLIKPFVTKLLQRWKISQWKEDRFLKSNHTWLNNKFSLPEVYNKSTNPSTSDNHIVRKKGRPAKTFQEGSKRTRRRIVKPMIAEASPRLLCSAAKTSLSKSGKRTAARVIDLALTTTPRRYKRMKEIHDEPNFTTVTPYTAEEAIAMIVDCNLTKEAYINIQEGVKRRGANIFPPYNVIAEAKKRCYPNNIKITDTEVSIPVQDVLDLTIQRLALVQQEVFEAHHNFDHNIPIEVTYKWGLDGSGGHSIYKQCFANNNTLYRDTNIMLCTIVPLQVSEQAPNGQQIFWQNPRPSSSKYSRILRLRIEKENKDTVKFMYAEIEGELSRLQPTHITLGDRSYTFTHKALCTMMDGKTCNVLTDTASSQACNVCKATPTELNNLAVLQRKQFPTGSFKFGISVLHSYLRCYEYLLHISYKLELQQWQARGEEAKAKIKERKKKITDLFYTKMGLVVDQPKQGGGNSNDGNTARKFFANPEMSASVTGLDVNLISRFTNILTVISSGYYINTENFRKYCFETAELCIELYSWYKMSASVHKLLLHGADIVKELPLPIGLFSEDVIERNQKEYKSIRLFHARKTSRVNTNTDIAHWMFIASDPIIASSRKPHKKKSTKPISNEVLEMLQMPSVGITNQAINAEEAINDDDEEGSDSE